MELDRWGAICFALGSTGLFLIAIAFTMPWYAIDKDPQSILSGRAGDDNQGRPIHTTGIALAGLVLGVFLWWVFVVTSVFRPSVARAAVGWLSVALLLLCLVHTATFYPLRSGWFVGLVAMVPIVIAASSDLNRSLFIERRMSEGPFGGS